MSAGSLVKITEGTAAEICTRYDPKDARALLRDGMSPREFVEALLAKKLYLPGIDFMAHALPPREGVWWGCLCMQHACGQNLSPVDRAAATAAVQWVLQPSDRARYNAKVQGEPAGPASVAGSLAMAAYQSGPAFPPPGGGPAPPMLPWMAPKVLANGVKLATTKADPTRIGETQKLFLELGIGIAEGRYI